MWTARELSGSPQDVIIKCHFATTAKATTTINEADAAIYRHAASVCHRSTDLRLSSLVSSTTLCCPRC
ncbi:unnamed protein product [Nippostrongylus brasiliensis]|uniref:Uncharacterized protein n=1 Tax=Nippostrongylus brasiliensis TaxID=27835 RepID=A0A0N4Y959_NIPBR|nr:unnamed protein product [Nippostrongylus brasiliensis]